VLGGDGKLGPISPNEIDDLLEQMTARPEASTSNSVFPEGGRCEGEVLRRNTVRG
jgi:hypothetical protein